MEQSTLFPDEGARSYLFLRRLLQSTVRSFEIGLRNPQASQHAVMKQIARLNRRTELGQAFGLDPKMSLTDFRQQVPTQEYPQVQPLIDRVLAGEKRVLSTERITGFVETSGTQATPKWIPITQSWSEHIRRAQMLWILGVLRDYPNITQGAIFHLVSAAKERREKGFSIGANTGRMVDALPSALTSKFVLRDVPPIEDMDLRHYVHLRLALQHPVRMWVTANPSTILVYARKLQQYQQYLAKDMLAGTLRHGPAATLEHSLRVKLEKRLFPMPLPRVWKPAQLWPLSLLGCWTGGPAQYFSDQFADILGGPVAVRDVGITASEGYFALPLHPDWNGGVLWNEGELLEFQAEDGRMYWGWELELGQQYQLVISAKNGLLRYAMKDIVEVTGWVEQTPIIRFVGKAGRYLNAVGEKVTEDQLRLAVQKLVPANIEAPIGFTGFMKSAEQPYLQLAIETTPACRARYSAERVDQALQQVSVEYASKRISQRLGIPVVIPISEGAYDAFRRWRLSNGATEAQVKDCIIAKDQMEWEQLLRFQCSE